MDLHGRKPIYTNARVVDESNLLDVLRGALPVFSALRCIFVSLHFSRREAETLEAVEGFVAHSVQHIGAVGADLLATFAVEVDVLLF